jgi:hypothetical protein
VRPSLPQQSRALRARKRADPVVGPTPTAANITTASLQTALSPARGEHKRVARFQSRRKRKRGTFVPTTETQTRAVAADALASWAETTLPRRDAHSPPAAVAARCQAGRTPRRRGMRRREARQACHGRRGGACPRRRRSWPHAGLCKPGLYAPSRTAPFVHPFAGQLDPASPTTSDMYLAKIAPEQGFEAHRRDSLG